LVEAPADLRSRDLGAVLGIQSRLTLAEQAGPEESRNDQPEDQRHWCDLPRPHASTPGRERDQFPPLPSPEEACSLDVGGRRASLAASVQRGAEANIRPPGRIR
jgi:hypothetical protein